jgi:hypothetical protein
MSVNGYTLKWHRGYSRLCFRHSAEFVYNGPLICFDFCGQILRFGFEDGQQIYALLLVIMDRYE